MDGSVLKSRGFNWLYLQINFALQRDLDLKSAAFRLRWTAGQRLLVCSSLLNSDAHAEVDVKEEPSPNANPASFIFLTGPSCVQNGSPNAKFALNVSCHS